jgi:hypothetical protein
MEAGLPGLSPTHRGGVHCVSQAVRDPYCQRYRWPSVEQQHRHPDIQDTPGNLRTVGAPSSARGRCRRRLVGRLLESWRGSSELASGSMDDHRLPVQCC